MVSYHSTRTAWAVKLSFLIYMAKKCAVTRPKMRKIVVCLSVRLQRKVGEFYLIFSVKLGDHKRRKVTQPDFSGKVSKVGEAVGLSEK